jgi:hypothetical protein
MARQIARDQGNTYRRDQITPRPENGKPIRRFVRIISAPTFFSSAPDTARVGKSPAMAPMITTRLRFRNLAIRPNLREADA